MKCAIYARVSTKEKSICPSCGKLIRVLEDRLIKHRDRSYVSCAGSDYQVPELADRGQDTENQLIQLREYCTRQGWVITAEYIDRLTAKHGQRDAFKEVFDAASRREFDVVLVWALDRFTREGVLETFEYVRTLTRFGVQFESFTEQHFRTTGPAGELMLAVAAWIAKQERLRISDRTKAGLDRARAKGKKCGRPIHVFRRDQAEELRKQGKSWRQIGAELNVPFATVRRALLAVSKR